ncbi:MAG: hypothetical protein ACE1Y2_03335 [Stenotrophomonas maltophilia]
MSVLSTIAIGINPNILDIGPFLLSWHGFLTFVAVATAGGILAVNTLVGFVLGTVAALVLGGYSVWRRNSESP